MSNYKRKSLVVARGIYNGSGYDATVYQITKTCVSQWAWKGCNNQVPPNTWPLREVRRRCLAAVKLLAARCDAHNAGVQRRPRLGTIKRILIKRQFASIGGDYRLLEQACSAFGSAQAAATWLTQPAAEMNGAVPGRLVKTQGGWWRVFHALVRIECAKYESNIPTG